MFFYIVLTLVSTTSGLWSTGNTRKYHQIDVYIYQFDHSNLQEQWPLRTIEASSNLPFERNRQGTPEACSQMCL